MIEDEIEQLNKKLDDWYEIRRLYPDLAHEIRYNGFDPTDTKHLSFLSVALELKYLEAIIPD